MNFSKEQLQRAFAAVSGVGVVGPRDVYELAVSYQNVAKTELEVDPTTGEQEIDWQSMMEARTAVLSRMQGVLDFDGGYGATNLTTQRERLTAIVILFPSVLALAIFGVAVSIQAT